MQGVQTGDTVWHETRAVAARARHSVMLAVFKGRVDFANGETGTYAGVEIVQLGDDREPFSGSHTFLLNDGSVSNQTFAGEVTRRDALDRVSGIGTWTIVDGTGRLAELHGGGTFTWSICGDTYRAEFGV